MDPWEHIEKAAKDHRAGSVAIARRASLGLVGASGKREVARAARVLLRAHPAMAPLWRMVSVAYESDDPARAAAAYVERLEAATDAAADSLRWVLNGRNAVVLTHSASGTVERALERVRGRVALVLCTTSLPGGEGRAFARRLERAGFATEVVPDAGAAAACARASIVLTGADAITDEGVVNKIGTRPLALAAYDAGVGCYAIAPTAKLLPAGLGRAAPAYETTPLELFDAVLTERGARRPGPLRRAIARIEIPDAIARIR